MFRAILRRLFFSQTLILSTCYAMNVLLIVDKIEIKKQSDGLGDQLYFYVIDEKANGKRSAELYPMYPFSYTQSNLVNFKPTVFWKGLVQQDQKVLLTLSVIEREMPPLIADQLCGTIGITLHNDKNQLKALWSVENFAHLLSKDHTLLTQQIDIKHENAEYTLKMHVEVQ
ncbi:hypothetical protein EBR43_03545 [bacterium]|nr:hypothetical protein [bacterium]NBX72073.1 hypothetical protein [bacterium]